MACSGPLKEAVGEISTGPNWLELPRDVTTNILERLGVVEIVTSACLVCPLWWNICKDPLMWRTIRMTDFSLRTYYLDKIFRHAVARSSGHLEEIDIYRFCTDDLLKFIADRTSRLRRLRLSRCWQGISVEGLIAVANKFPLLEELDLTDNFLSSKDFLEVIGQCCPLLKSFKLFDGYTPAYALEDKDGEAFMIAKSMSGLRRLEVSYERMTIVGLLAILDGCPLLEYLDVQYFIHLELSESLERRRRQQIKESLLPCKYCIWFKPLVDTYGVSQCFQQRIKPHSCLGSNFSLVNGSVGSSFTPLVITVKAGEDLSSRIVTLSQNAPRNVCILYAKGSISNATLRQSATAGGALNYEGLFVILSLTGSLLHNANGSQHDRFDGLSVSLSRIDGRVLSGGVAGPLIAASPIQLVLGCFPDRKEAKSSHKIEDASAPTATAG